MLAAELRQSPNRHAVLLIRAYELEPELALCQHRGGLSAHHEKAQRSVAKRALLMNARLQRAQLLARPTRQHSGDVHRSVQHLRNASSSAVV